MPSIYWIAFGDVHNRTERLAGVNGLKEAAGIIVTGDLTFAQGAVAAQKVLDAIETAGGSIAAAQIGNMDKSEISDLLQAKRINLHGQAIKLHPEVTIIGVGGSNITPFNTPSEFSEEELDYALRRGLKMAGSYERLIVASHTPPLDTACDKLPGGGHAGSLAVRAFIEEVQPGLCLCGHIHEARGMDMIGNTPVINPGSFADGGYVKITLEDGVLESALLLAE